MYTKTVKPTWPIFAEQNGLGSSYLPFYIRNTHFLSGLLIVVEPFPICQVNAGELGSRFETFGEEVSLFRLSDSGLDTLKMNSFAARNIIILGRYEVRGQRDGAGPYKALLHLPGVVL